MVIALCIVNQSKKKYLTKNLWLMKVPNKPLGTNSSQWLMWYIDLISYTWKKPEIFSLPRTGLCG